MSPTEDITDVRDLVQRVNDARTTCSSSSRFYYRGTPRFKYDLTPKLLRKPLFKNLLRVHEARDAVGLQRALLERLHRYASPRGWGTDLILPEPKQDFGQALCVAQHHGLPTLLLDWTLNPLGALYFAASKDASAPGAVWFMKLKSRSERRDYTVHCEAGQRLSERSEIPLLVIPRSFSRRIEVQAGRFVYFGEYDEPLDKLDIRDAPWSELGCWSVGEKAKLLKQLEYYQIHRGTMFPDLDGYAEYLKSGGL